MSKITKRLLSGSTNGKQIKLTGTTTTGAVTIHTAVSGSTALDEIWLFADNDHTSDVLLTVQWGGTTDIDNTIKKTIPARGNTGDGKVAVVAGEPLNGALVVKAFAGSASKVKLSGFVNRIEAQS